MSIFKRIGMGFLCAVCAISFFGCEKEPDKKPESESAASVHSSYNAIEGLEKDYVYMWYPNGLDDNQNAYINFQTENYGLSFNSRTGALEGMSPLDYTGAYFEEMDVNRLAFIPTMYYDVKTSAGRIRTTGEVEASTDTNRLYARAIESGRNMQRLDVISMKYQNIEGTLISKNYLGRVEIAANREYFSISYGVYNNGNNTLIGADLSFSMDLGLTYSNIEVKDGRRIVATDKNGDGFTFIVASGAQASANGSIITFEKKNIDLPLALEYNGFGVVVVPTNSNASAESIMAQEQAKISAVQVQPTNGRAQNAVYDGDRGIFVVNTDNMMPCYEPFQENQLDSYEKLNFTIENKSTADITVPVAFEKTAGSSFNAMGYVPMIRRTDGEQTGISVQISKNWHTYDGGDTAQYPVTHYKRYLEGKWSMCYAMVEIPAGQTVEFEYCVVFAKWGGVYSVSHSQLCLIGYAADWIWDQSCLGSWGESVCYDPDRSLGRSLIDDMRPFGIKSKAGAYNEYHWTDNVGGADFLWYYSLDQESSLHEGRIINQKINYRSQGPNMSDVVYLGRTDDGCIDTFLNIRMGRTDDVIRCYYTVTYEVVSDLAYANFALFKLGAEKYATTSYTKFAVGNENGILRDDTFYGMADATATEIDGVAPWFMLYGGSTELMVGNKMFTVREYSAKVNGVEYDKPSYKITTTNNGGIQPSIELSVPEAAGKILRAGSRFDMVIEMVILPNPSADVSSEYYGNADYLVETKDLFNTAQSALQQAQGNNLTVNIDIGKLRGRYPVEIDTVKGETLAQFTMCGGLGYTPVVFNGLSSASGYSLQIKQGNEWKDVVQSGNKGETKDYYQVRKLADGTYQWIFNVKNSEGTDFHILNEYRLVNKSI